LKISKDVEEMKLSTKALSEDVMLNFDDKQIKIEELFDHFEKKD
jgi:hypothetical protein